MKIINLMEDTKGAEGCLFEHGLSFYIETAHHKVLLDTGASDAFLQNAEQRGIDLSAVDAVFISHGHYDHAGGILAFAHINPKATIYIHKNAVGEYYNCAHTPPKYIGMDKRIAALAQVVFTEGDVIVDHELSVFTGVRARRLFPRGNLILKKKIGEDFIPDVFDHEQYLVVTEGDTQVLLSGCAHNGILNILDTYRALYGSSPSYVISGFHTMKAVYEDEDEQIITSIAAELAKMPTVFYSGHCTGAHALELMKPIMGDKLNIIHSGDILFAD